MHTSEMFEVHISIMHAGSAVKAASTCIPPDMPADDMQLTD